MTNIVFLDYDGVVNTPMWKPDGSSVRYNFPEDGKVNNFQAVQWLSEFCQKYAYNIVVTSSWRLYPNWESCLRDGGLRSCVKVIGQTPFIENKRGTEIKCWLKDHSDIQNYVVLDDENFRDFKTLQGHVVLCEPETGITPLVYDRLVQGHMDGEFAV